MSEVVIVPYEGKERDAICAIRETVFVHEQKVPPELEFDGLDGAALHVLALVNGQPVGTGRVLEDGHIGRIAILEAFRGLGIGAQVVVALVDAAQKAGCTRVYLGSQTHAVEFYRKLGFTPYGEEFMDAGIPHIHMEKSL
ncbi:GNAT family N-acetyltransferase [Marinobacterium sediminicola]|uniref:Predicted N-acyltransferase, GNAT family n=1 Tax=Marinobacterium sediminicola TaxID=518898 RepID=A0ABY1RWD5_9GAMM|nr:GNAT family N-acetyltransferase [Marinobacterium sediminicola]ULG70389.1 GNAT family N-acetyltransferase [Marinobacterium sediminicola]SMR69517.1 Predicted N-acyltransferase, GNAT family [Marinobacterium sediminicola]